MRFILTTLLLPFLILNVQAQDDPILIEAVDNGGIVSGNTYRLYLVLEEGQSLHAIFGDDMDQLMIESEEELFQHEFGSHDGSAMNQAMISIYPDLEFDSFITIGSPEPDNQAWHAGIDWNSWNEESNLYTNNGAWFVLPDAAFTQPDEQLKILLGQFTSSGAVFGIINAQGNSEDQSQWQLRGLEFHTDNAQVFGCMDPEADNYNQDATYEDGSCDFSSSISTLNSTEDLFSVHPNPIEDDALNMEIGSEYLRQRIVMEVFDAAGKLVQKEDFQAMTKNVSLKAHFEPGIYTVRLTAGQFTQQARVVR
ncbi:MAG: T9SS type A sorting domain-containing protein [Flavobacteriales bacterium]|nr:T9SS type A sorting domain-containing protein [Flavobacteriales bacterium]